jgi:hypothetical protein
MDGVVQTEIVASYDLPGSNKAQLVCVHYADGRMTLRIVLLAPDPPGAAR